jgi:hypothetical protein
VLRFYGKVLWGMFSMRDTDVVEGASITLWRTWGADKCSQIHDGLVMKRSMLRREEFLGKMGELMLPF